MIIFYFIWLVYDIIIPLVSQGEAKKEKAKNKIHNEEPEEKDYSYDRQERQEREGREKYKSKREVDESKKFNISRQVDLAIAALQSCIEKDKVYAKRELPTLEKLKLLPNVEKVLVKRHIAEEFLKRGGLKLLQEYLIKNEDGTYTTVNQIERILDLLDLMPVEKSHIEDCYINDCINEIIKNKILSENIRKKAIKLNNKWAKIISEYDINFSNIEAENKIYNRLFKKRHLIDTDEGKKKYEELNDTRKIPNKALFDYTVQPESREILLNEDDRIGKKNFFVSTGKDGIKIGKKKVISMHEFD